MRPWMKLLSVGGLVGAMLGVSWAGERISERSVAPTTKTKRPDRMEYFSRSSAPTEGTPDISSLIADPEADALAADASATPQRFVRKKIAPANPSNVVVRDGKPTPVEGSQASLATAFKKSGSRIENPAGKDESSTNSLKAISGTAKKKSAAESVQEVEILPSPDSADLVQEDDAELESPKPLVVRPASFRSTPEASSKKRPVVVDDSEASEVIDAGYVDRGGSGPRIQKVSADQGQVAQPKTEKTAPALIPPAKVPPAKVNRAASVSERPAKAVNLPSQPTWASSRSATQPNESAANGTPTVTVEWVKRNEIVVGQECDCELLVKNSGKLPARQVVVEAFFPASVRLTQADPEPVDATDHLEWLIPNLPAGSERVIRIAMIPSQRGDLATTANVRFTGTAASVFTVAEPLLAVNVQSPTDVVIGDPLVKSITVSNPGTGVAQNVKLHLTLPEGLEHARGDRSQIDIGRLNAGESRTIRLSFTAIAGGEQTLVVEASGDSGLRQVAESTVDVIAPMLKLAVRGDDLHQVGRDSQLTITVLNDGQAPADNVRVAHRLPKGFRFVKADHGGSLDATQGIVNWTIGHLEPNQISELTLHVLAQQEGEFTLEVQAASENSGLVKANAVAAVEGAAKLALEILDLEEPSPVGQDSAYEVRVSNTGSRVAENVSLTFELPSGLELIDVESATQHLAKKGLVLFDDLPKLQPGKTALYRIHVKAKVAGTQRVRARLTSESTDEELVIEEVTKFQAE